MHSLKIMAAVFLAWILAYYVGKRTADRWYAAHQKTEPVMLIMGAHFVGPVTIETPYRTNIENSYFEATGNALTLPMSCAAE